MTRITDRIFLGNYLDAQNEEFLNQNQIDLVINVAVEIPKPNYKYVNPWYYKYRLYDIPEQNILHYSKFVYDLIEEFLSKSNKNILIHCRAGISRSASLLIAYLMKKNHWNLDQAYWFVKRKRDIIQPNTGFVNQLKQLN